MRSDRQMFEMLANGVHAGLVAVLVWLAGILAWPGSTFATGQGYAKFAAAMSEVHWALLFASAAAVGLVGLWDLRTREVRWRLVCLWVLSTMHGLVAGLFAWGNPAGTATGVYGVLALLGYLLMWMRARAVAG